MPPKDFQKTLLEAIQEGLSSLGDSPKQAILFHLENTFKIKLEEIPTKPAQFQKALETLFGPGAPYLEQLILEKLYNKLDLNFNGHRTEQTDFSNNIENLKQRILMGDA
ncbi:hypothetical protein KEJ45_00190 [Candidatus Bathyarchaeota archaeon]|nr:hypothetical protein [Candidatus Bathyarchaeota archaeon]